MRAALNWIAIILIAPPILYAATFGPACWWLSKPVELSGVRMKARRIPAAYSPIAKLARRVGPGKIQGAANWYATVGIRAGECVVCGAFDRDDPGVVFVRR
jgi:hypothetical protein